jgi:hypothetical protein
VWHQARDEQEIIMRCTAVNLMEVADGDSSTLAE